jgi:hypothetical protein
MTRTDAALAAAVLGACLACSAPDAPAPPSPAAVAPASGFASVDTLVEITGEGFHVSASQGSDAGSAVESTYRAWLGTTELLDVVWLDPNRLHARVPSGLALGWHDLGVEGPYGSGTLPSAYRVVDGVPASLAVSLSMPSRMTIGDELQVIVRAENRGTSHVDGVQPTVAVAGYGGLELVSGGAAGTELLPGGTCDFVLRYRAVRTGAVSVSASVAGTDPRIGQAVSASTSAVIIVRPPPSVSVVAEDPFSDQSAFAFVAGYRGQVYVGPSRNGTGLVRLAPDGTALESLPLSFSRDGSGNTSGNSASPYRSIGFSGCTQDSLVDACGPDDENGRGFMTSVSFKGDEWLLLGGGRSGGDLDYVYLSRSAAAPLAFSYVDLSAALGGNTRGFSAALASGDRLYLGFPDDGGERPYGLALLAAPPTPGGLDAVKPTHVLNLNLRDAFDAAYHSFSSISMVDTIAELGGRLYFFNDSGCIVARTLTPTVSGDFSACSPAEGATYDLARSVEPPRAYDLEPHHRAWPAAVAWRGRLFAIRNTLDGPQLWRCDPAAGTDPAACDRADWTLVAADASHLTRFGRADAVASLLLATETDLWIGFDGPVGGIRLFRTPADVPAAASDFRGKDGCIAAEPACEGVGGDGFGTPATLTRILDGKAIDWSGGTDLILAAGDGAGPVRIVRVAP